MEQNPNCGGCSGEIEVEMNFLKDIKAFRIAHWLMSSYLYYEYKLNHTPDKACNSFFGYNSSLPGAYQMFRHEAVEG